MQELPFLIGIGLCFLAIFQLGYWTTMSLGQRRAERERFAHAKQQLQKQINAQKVTATEVEASGNWNGFRWFEVARLERESDLCTSVYLKPIDRKPIPGFHPGQHLTFRFRIPGNNKPVVRCYSLSDSPNRDYYRISVKKVLPPRDQPTVPSGRASTFVNEMLKPGDRIEVKAPSGHFFLQEESTKPIILMAGGVGITPMVSMANHLMESGNRRSVTLIYAARNSKDQPFGKHFRDLDQRHRNFSSVYCYSHILSTERIGSDYDAAGYVTMDLVKQSVPTLDSEYYLCGPPPFMESVYHGLIESGVPETQIYYEAFGPASIGKAKKTSESTNQTSNSVVKFSKTEIDADWTGEHGSILEFAEANDVYLDSGCRAGSCGTCAIKILKGKVEYESGQQAACGPDECLVCVAKPNGDLELEA